MLKLSKRRRGAEGRGGGEGSGEKNEEWEGA